MFLETLGMLGGASKGAQSPTSASGPAESSQSGIGFSTGSFSVGGGKSMTWLIIAVAVVAVVYILVQMKK